LTELDSTTNLKVTLSNGAASKDYFMNIIVPNRPPIFSDGTTSFPTISVSLNHIYNLAIPPFEDPDLTTPTLAFTQSSNPIVQASLVGNTNLRIAPVAFTEVGNHSTFFELADSKIKL
jgi:hypothetical protein